jgi:GNAT superfamily N-acetyltransferase
MSPEPTVRRAVPADAPAMAGQMVEGLADYRVFAPAGWRAPAAAEEEAHLRALLPDPAIWSMVAEYGGRLVGQVTLVPAARAAHPVPDPGLAHLRNLFVDREFWGGGLAAALHAAVVAAARERGFTGLRLFVATGQERARRFYAREGWTTVGPPFFDPVPGLELVELRRRAGS